MGEGGGREAQKLHNHLKAPFNLNCVTWTVGGNQSPWKKERSPERRSDLGPPRCEATVLTPAAAPVGARTKT